MAAILAVSVPGCESAGKPSGEVLEHFAISARLGQPVGATIQQYPGMTLVSDGSYEEVLSDSAGVFGFMKVRTAQPGRPAPTEPITEISLDGRPNASGAGVRRQLEVEIGRQADRIRCLRLGERSTEIRTWKLAGSHVSIAERSSGGAPLVDFRVGRPRDRWGSPGPCTSRR